MIAYIWPVLSSICIGLLIGERMEMTSIGTGILCGALCLFFQIVMVK